MDLMTLTDLCTPWCVHVAVTLRIAEHMQAGHREIEQLARAAAVDPDSLARVLRHMVSKGVFEEPVRGEFVLNGAARALLEEPVRLGLDLNGIGGRMAYVWSTLLRAVQTGRPAYQEIFGSGFWDDLEAHPEIAASFDALMGLAGHGIPDWQILLDPTDWDAVQTVADVGGGTGALLAEILRARPEIKGILIDLPRTAARSGEVFEAAGVVDRVTISAQSFFDPLPAGCDLYCMKNVLADWPDQEAKILLKRCAEAARPAGRVVIAGGVAEQDTSPELLMMVLVGGKARSLDEFRDLAAKAGLKVHQSGRNRSGRFVVECAPV
jgi:SAM-dependent methyltransferase